jgi:hypothetical protein
MAKKCPAWKAGHFRVQPLSGFTVFNIANWLMILFMTIFASHHSCAPYYFSSNTLHYAVQDALIKEYKSTGC